MATYRKIHLPFLASTASRHRGSPLPCTTWVAARRHEYLLRQQFPNRRVCAESAGSRPDRFADHLAAGAAALRYLVPARRLENHVFYAAVNRVGEERGFRFIGQSKVVDYSGETLASCESEREEIVLATIDPEKAREKRIVQIPGKYEVDRVRDRRPEMYGPICAPLASRPTVHD